MSEAATTQIPIMPRTIVTILTTGNGESCLVIGQSSEETGAVERIYWTSRPMNLKKAQRIGKKLADMLHKASQPATPTLERLQDDSENGS